MSEIAKMLDTIEKQLASERADIGFGLPMFARGRLNLIGNEDYHDYRYIDIDESRIITLDPV